MTVGLVGLGHMGSAIGWALRQGGTAVVASGAGRSTRSVDLAERAGIRLVAGLERVLEEAGTVLVVTPPGAALTVAGDLVDAAVRTGTRPVVADLNAIAPATVLQIQRVLEHGGLDCVDGSISGAPPGGASDTRIYLSGPKASHVASLGWTRVETTVLGSEVGTASALKMCLSVMQKGVLALATRSLMAADQYDVIPRLVEEADRAGLGSALREVALASRKAPRYVDEMRELSSCFAQVPASASVLAGLEQIWRDVAMSPLADGDPEDATLAFDPRRAAAGLRRSGPAATRRTAP